jgi:PHD/YefM family antitoxin component YafN of YafNO toxin-antitoxin module
MSAGYIDQNDHFNHKSISMKTMTAANAKTNFGAFLDNAQREPVVVTKNNRAVGVMFSMQDIEDTIWGERARKAHAEGYIGTKASDKLLAKLLNAKT